MNTKQLLEAIVDCAEDKKAQDVVVLDIRGLSVMADYFVICHGNSETQVQAIADAIREKGLELGIDLRPPEGLDFARWVLIDLGDIIVHVFHKEDREFYNLEKIWADASRIQVSQSM
jgi:ribosome-associated protein